MQTASLAKATKKATRTAGPCPLPTATKRPASRMARIWESSTSTSKRGPSMTISTSLMMRSYPSSKTPTVKRIDRTIQRVSRLGRVPKVTSSESAVRPSKFSRLPMRRSRCRLRSIRKCFQVCSVASLARRAMRRTSSKLICFMTERLSRGALTTRICITGPNLTNDYRASQRVLIVYRKSAVFRAAKLQAACLKISRVAVKTIVEASIARRTRAAAGAWR